jgi:Uma2 family endonuclease
MPLLIEDTWLPATLTAPRMTDEEFVAFCNEHPDLNFETTASGELVVMPQTFTSTGFRNQEIGYQLQGWSRSDGRGGAADSSTGYVLPNGARRSPDASWVLKERIRKLDRYSLDHFYHLCPDFVIELRSESDRLTTLRRKMREWTANGAQLGWLIDPSRPAVETFRAGREYEVRENVLSVEGEGPVAGFVLDLHLVWEDPSD